MSTITASVRTIDPQELYQLVKQGESIELIDVRTPAEFREVHAEIARNEPLDKLNPRQWMQSHEGDIDRPLYFICRSDGRGKKACEAFLKAGYSNVWNVAGGTVAWADLNLPIVRGKQTTSLERQVRIAAGLLVLAGAVLSMTVHPLIALLPAFVGARLMFAGITDTCGMAMLLARMPWYQLRNTSSARASDDVGQACKS